ncbi:MAG: DMT family transporter [Candidatus Heimdallarchaeaceae archaeon]
MTFVLGIVLSFSAALFWGTGFVIFKVGVRNTKPLAATFLRGVIAVPIFLLISITAYGINSITAFFTKDSFFWLIASVITIALGDFFSLFAMRKLDASIAQPISATYPVFTNVILLIVSLEIVTPLIITGTLLNVLGAAIISLYSNNRNKKSEEKKNKENCLEEETENKQSRKINIQGVIYSLLAAIFWGSTIVCTKILLTFDKIFVIPMLGVRNGLMITVAGLILLFDIIHKKTNRAEIQISTRKDFLFLASGGIITWLGGGFSFFTAVNLIGAARSTPISSISPFIVLLWSFLFLKEKIVKLQILGVAFIVLGSILLSI